MKTKIIALMMAVFCLSMCFVGCGKACEAHVDEDDDGICDVCEVEIPVPPCETHTDADKNQECDVCKAKVIAPCDVHKDDDADKICDVCQRAIVVLDVKDDSKEERVDMIVNAIPEGVEVGKYVELKDETSTTITSATFVSGTVEDYTADQKFLLIKEAGSLTTTYTVYDAVNGKIVKYIQSNNRKTLNVELYEAYFVVTTQTYDSGIRESASKDYYTYGDKILHSVTWTRNSAGEGTDWYAYLSENDVKIDFERNQNGDETYVTVWTPKKVYAIDYETRAIIQEASCDEFIYRPNFDEITDKYGYVEYKNTVFVYDLSKWVNCVASYKIPSYVEGGDWFVLENGNVLIFGVVQMPDGAVSYDAIEDGTKCDLVYTILDVATNAATDVEFGYVISSQIDTENGYTAQALNAFKVYPIINDRVASAYPKMLVVDNAMQILYGYDIAANETYTLVSDNLFHKITKLDADTRIDEIVNEKGEHVAYVPYGAHVYANYIAYNDAIYNFKMEILCDLKGAQNIFWTKDYVIFATEDAFDTKYYYYDVTGSSMPVEIDVDNMKDVIVSDMGFIVSYSVRENGDDIEILKHRLYNADNQFVCYLDCEGETIRTSGAGLTFNSLTENNSAYLVTVSTYGSTYYYIAK